MDWDKNKVGYVINSNRHFYKHIPTWSPEKIDEDLEQATAAIGRQVREMSG